MNRILIVEDEAIIRMSLRKLLQRHHYQISEAESVREATSLYDINHFDLIISDLRLPGAPGTEFINLTLQHAQKTAQKQIPVLIMTSYASLRSAVDAMRMGAVDYIAKPFDHDEMVDTVKRILDAQSKNIAQEKSGKKGEKSRKMIGTSEVMAHLTRQINKVAPTNASILIEGETGTGKELVARAVHNESQRKSNALICINCAAIPENLIESELFGHEKGAFTGAASQRDGLIVSADKGTLFLDEIGELPLEAQARLLRVLQEGEVRPVGSTKTQRVNIRLLAATHRDLHERCKQGLFREDLFFRLNVIKLNVPPLRQRGNDIILLAESLTNHYCESNGKAPLKLSFDAQEAVLQYDWPGNVRELENTMQRAVILCEHPTEIDASLLNLHVNANEYRVDTHDTQAPKNKTADVVPINIPTSAQTEDLSLEDYFQRFVLENQDKMSETDLAKKLGVSRKCLWERRQKLGIPRKK